MIPTSFDYEKPASLEDAITLLQQRGSEARVLAGGQSLLVLLKARSVAPKVLIDIGGLSELRRISRTDGSVTIGALATQAELMESEEMRRTFPLFGGDALLEVGDPMVRSRGTFCGALAFADPAGDWPAIALALDVQVYARNANGSWTLPLDEFLLDPFATSLQPTDLLTHVTIPVVAGHPAMVYRKLRHPASGYALVGVAAVLARAADGTCSDCRVAVTGAGRRAVRTRAVEDALLGQQVTPEAITRASGHASMGIHFLDDLYADPDYRDLLVRTYVKRALLDALSAL